jgi:hypothetical protein
MRLFRLLLVAALMFSGWHVARGTWAYFGRSSGHEPANGTLAFVAVNTTAAASAPARAAPTPAAVPPGSRTTVHGPENAAASRLPQQGPDAAAASSPSSKPNDSLRTHSARQRMAIRHKAIAARRSQNSAGGPGQATKAAWLATASEVGRWLAAREADRDRTWREARQSVLGFAAQGLRSRPADTKPPVAPDSQQIVETNAAGPSLEFPASQSANPAEAKASAAPSALFNKPSSPPGRAADGASVTLINPRESGGPVRFLLNGRESVLRPGETQQLSADRTWLIEFHRGGDFGEARYTLTSGAYRFRVTGRGWELVASSAR